MHIYLDSSSLHALTITNYNADTDEGIKFLKFLFIILFNKWDLIQIRIKTRCVKIYHCTNKQDDTVFKHIVTSEIISHFVHTTN